LNINVSPGARKPGDTTVIGSCSTPKPILFDPDRILFNLKSILFNPPAVDLVQDNDLVQGRPDGPATDTQPGRPDGGSSALHPPPAPTP
jgi:hypothetical protein